MFYKCSCPTERGACLEVSLQSEGAHHNSAPTALNLYAVQAFIRPSRLSSYSWVSRGKTYHRLLLNSKGLPSGNTVNKASALSKADCSKENVVPLLDPIHIAVVCPEQTPPRAPAFDHAVGLSSYRGSREACVGRGTEGKGIGSPEKNEISEGTGVESSQILRGKFSIVVRVVGPPRIILEGR